MQNTYILIMILSLALIGILFWFKSRKSPAERRKPSSLALLGMLLVVMSVVIGENRWVGYSLMGTGVALVVLDLFLNRK